MKLFSQGCAGRLRAWSIVDGGLGAVVLAGGLVELVTAGEVDAGDESVRDVFAEGSRELQEMTWSERLEGADDAELELEHEAMLVELDRIVAEAEDTLRAARQGAEIDAMMESLRATADAIRESGPSQWLADPGVLRKGKRVEATAGVRRRSRDAAAEARPEVGDGARGENVAKFRRQLEIIQLLVEQQDDDDSPATHADGAGDGDGDEDEDDDEDEVPVHDRRRRAPNELYFEDLPFFRRICCACGEPMADEGARCGSCGQG
jgi:hypothetical protein